LINQKPTNLCVYNKEKKGEERNRESSETNELKLKVRISTTNVILFLFPYIVQTEKKENHPHRNEIMAL